MDFLCVKWCGCCEVGVAGCIDLLMLNLDGLSYVLWFCFRVTCGRFVLLLSVVGLCLILMILY